MSATTGNYSESLYRDSEGSPCRLCMKKNDCYYNIFTSIVASQITVEDALHDLVDLKVAVGDGLPATLCPLCLRKIIEFYDFRNICHESDAELRKFSSRNNFTSTGEEGAVHDNLRSSTQSKDCVFEAIVGTSEKACSVQPNEIFIPVQDIQLPKASMLCHAKVQNKECQIEENNEMLLEKAPDGIEGDAIDPLAMDDMFCAKQDNEDPLGEENNEVVHGTAPDGIESDAIDPLAMDDMFCAKEDNKDPLREENNKVLHWTAPEEFESDARDPLAIDDLPTFNENGEFIENLAMATEPKAEAAGLPGPERSQMKTSSASYLLAVEDVRIDQSYGRLPPSNTVTLIQFKSGASHTEGGKNVIDKDLEKCGAFHGDNVKLCLFPNDGQFYMKDIQASKISGDGTRKSFVWVGCDDLVTTESLGCIESREKTESGNEALMEKEEEICNDLVKNPGNICRSNDSLPYFLSTRDGVNTKNEASKHLQTNIGARNLDGDVELLEGQDESIKAIVLNEDSDTLCSTSSSNTMGGMKMKRKGMRKKVNRPIKENSGKMGERKILRKNGEISTVDRKMCPQNVSLKSHSCIENRLDQPCGSSMERVYSCSECAETYTQRRVLSKHMLMHAREESYSCQICEKCFFRTDHLNEHMRTHRGEKPYSCDVCSRSFSSKRVLVKHCRTHSGESPFSCSLCCKSFYQSGNLTVHMRSHNGEKPYSCNVCSNSFTQKHSLDEHMRTHTGEKPYSCGVCLKSFSRKGGLVTHCRIHTGERPYSCSICCKSFYQSCDLIKHRRTHTGEKPYACSICSKRFSQSGILDRHMRTHLGDKL